MSVINRIKQIIEYKEISVRQFCIEVGIANGFLDKVKDVGSEKLLKILYKYPDISPEWLLTGNGAMQKEDNRMTKIYESENNIYNSIVSDAEIPLYDIEAAANLKTIFADKTQNIIDKIRIPQLPKCDGAVYVRGDSMYPLLKAGDIVVFKEIYNMEYLTTGEMYLVDYTIEGDDYLVVKYIQKGDSEGKVKLVSYNGHHQSLDIPVSAIRSLAIVKASIRLNTMI